MLAVSVSAAPAADIVTSLPNMTNFTYGVYSGFLNLTATKKIYYLFEESKNDPKTDPLILWSNGGPGCSSLLGWLGEVGHYIQQDDGSFLENNHSFNMNASVLYFDHPAPVGWSTCKDAECHANDTTDGIDNAAAVKAWFDLFPEFKTNNLWLAGESYAGIYLPTLLYQLDKYNQNVTDKINVKGMMIGNGVTNWTYDTQPATFNMTYWHAIMGQDMYENLTANECDFSMMNFGKVPNRTCLDIFYNF